MGNMSACLMTVLRYDRDMHALHRPTKADLSDPIGEGQGKRVLLSQSGGLGSEAGEVQGL